MSGLTPPPGGTSNVTLPIAESDVTNLTTDLAAKAPLASPALTGHPTGVTESAGDNSTRLASTAYVDTASGLLVPKSLLTTRGDIAYASAASTPARLGIGTLGQTLDVNDQGVPEWVTEERAALIPATMIADTYNRRQANSASVAMAGTTGVCCMQVIWLRKGQVISNIQFMGGATTAPVASGTHLWFFLTDINRVMVACTADDTGASSWAVNTLKSMNIAQIASGASSTYTVAATGVYYLGYNITAGTIGNGIFNNGLTAVMCGLPPIISGTSETISTGPPSFPKTFTALTSVTKMLYGGVG